MTLRWKIRDKLTGEVREGEASSEGYANSDEVYFHWTEGNYGCDCARAQFFAESAGEPDPGMKCGIWRFELCKLLWGDVEIIAERER